VHIILFLTIQLWQQIFQNMNILLLTIMLLQI
jgi:hypothetical protein